MDWSNLSTNELCELLADRLDYADDLETRHAALHTTAMEHVAASDAQREQVDAVMARVDVVP